MVTFARTFGPASAKQIAALEKALAVKLPADYKRFLRTTNGGVPAPDCFAVPERGDALCGILFGVREKQGPADLAWEHQQASEWEPLPRGFIAIGRDPGGNMLLLATSGKQAGQVFFGDRNGLWTRKDGHNTFPVARSFTAFIAALRELPTDSESKAAPSKRTKGRRITHSSKEKGKSAADVIKHPVFGELRWDQKYSWWSTQLRLPSGNQLEVIVNPVDTDRFSFIDAAAKHYRRALKGERRILRDAIREELLDLYNDYWRQGEKRLTARELMNRLKLSLIEFGTVVPITLNYEAGDLFGHHAVAVFVDDELQFDGIDLEG
jgi:hypothetical protein